MPNNPNLTTLPPEPRLQDSVPQPRQFTTSLADGLPLAQFLRQALSDYHPDRQHYYAACPIRAVETASDTLSDISAVYGPKAARLIIIPHITDLLVFVSSKNGMDERSLILCADTITQSFPLIRVTELMLFFHRYKSGAYGQPYGSLTPLDITCALRRFLPYLYDLRERSEWRAREREREERARQAVPYHKYKQTFAHEQ